MRTANSTSANHEVHEVRTYELLRNSVQERGSKGIFYVAGVHMTALIESSADVFRSYERVEACI